jgi:hypothetical protein
MKKLLLALLLFLGKVSRSLSAARQNTSNIAYNSGYIENGGLEPTLRKEIKSPCRAKV